MSMGSGSSNTVWYIAGVIVILVIAAIAVLSGVVKTPYSPTTIPANLTPTSVSITTSIVPNLTTAVGPNTATCNGYNVSEDKAYYDLVGYCNWRGGLLNLSLTGGTFQSATLEMVQQNITSAPFNISTTTATCTPKSGVIYVPPGNYKVSFSTSLAATGTCGAASMRLTASFQH